MIANPSSLFGPSPTPSATPSPAAGFGGLTTGITQGISDAIGNLADDHNQMGGVIQGMKNDLDNLLRQAGVGPQGTMMPGPAGAGGSQVTDQFRSHVTRLAYVTVLHKAIKKTKHQKNFNFDTAMTDLWNALQNIKQGDRSNQQIASKQGASNQVPAVQNQMAQTLVTLQTMNSMMQQMHVAAGQTIKNMAP